MVSGSTGASTTEPSACATRARSSAVTAFSHPIVQPLEDFPDSFTAPRIVVTSGRSTYPPPIERCGARPIRRE
ncbi:MAG: hypothetical protein FWJ74_13160 [Gemmatimonadota bacterium]